MSSSTRLWDLCQRIAGMSWDELRVRGRQEAAKRWDLAVGRIGGQISGEQYSSSSENSGRFFFGPNDVPALLGFLRMQLPEVVEDIVARAEQICRHQFDLLGYRAVDWGKEIDWHFDPIHGKRAPRSPWFRIRYLDFDQVGDAKIIWELNRHQHMVTLAKAHRLTGKARYARELFQQWYHWHEQNRYGTGINWSSSLEVAFRSLSWIWVAHLLQGCSIVPKNFSADLASALTVNARHIERFLSTYFSPNTHLLGEGVGLFFIGTLSRRSAQSQRWQEHGWRIVLQEAQRQVQPDGMHFEQSTYYHAYALDFFLHARTLAQVNGMSIPAAFDRTIAKMLSVFAALTSAGPLPRLGDDDGGRVFDPYRNGQEHLADSLATGAALFKRGEFKNAAGKICEETIWLLGIEGAQRFEQVPAQSHKISSFALQSSGTYVMCSSRPVAQRLIIDAGPQSSGRAGHSHADALSLQLAVDGHPVLIDPGTSAYVGPNNERDSFRGTAAHNTVRVDGLSQADPTGPFGWKDLPKVKVDRWLTGETFDFFSGWHGGYTRLTSPVRHYRHVFYLKPHFWLIRDVLTGSGSHRVEAAWHFAPGTLSAIPGGAQYCDCDNQSPLTVLFTAKGDFLREISQDLHSLVYGRMEPAPTLRLSTSARVPVEFATLLVPVGRFAQPAGILRAFDETRDGIPVQTYVWSRAADEAYFFFAEQSGSWRVGPWTSDARFVFASMDDKKNFNQVIVCDGSYLDFFGQRIFSSRTPEARSKCVLCVDGQQVSCFHGSSVMFTSSTPTTQHC